MFEQQIVRGRTMERLNARQIQIVKIDTIGIVEEGRFQRGA